MYFVTDRKELSENWSLRLEQKRIKNVRLKIAQGRKIRHKRPLFIYILLANTEVVHRLRFESPLPIDIRKI